MFAGGSAHLVGDGWLPVFVFYWHRAPERSDGLKGVVLVFNLGNISAIALCQHFVGVFFLFLLIICIQDIPFSGSKLVTTEVVRVRTDSILM